MINLLPPKQMRLVGRTYHLRKVIATAWLALGVVMTAVLLAGVIFLYVTIRYGANRKKIARIEEAGGIPRQQAVATLAQKTEHAVDALASSVTPFSASALVPVVNTASLGIVITDITMNGTTGALVTGTTKDKAFFDQYIIQLQDAGTPFTIKESHYNTADTTFLVSIIFTPNHE